MNDGVPADRLATRIDSDGVMDGESRGRDVTPDRDETTGRESTSSDRDAGFAGPVDGLIATPAARSSTGASGRLPSRPCDRDPDRPGAEETIPGYENREIDPAVLSEPRDDSEDDEDEEDKAGGTFTALGAGSGTKSCRMGEESRTGLVSRCDEVSAEARVGIRD